MKSTKEFLKAIEKMRLEINKSGFININENGEATLNLTKPIKKGDQHLQTLVFRDVVWRDVQTEDLSKIIHENKYSDLMRIACRISKDNLSHTDVGDLSMIDSGGVIKIVSYFLSLIVISQV